MEFLSIKAYHWVGQKIKTFLKFVNHKKKI